MIKIKVIVVGKTKEGWIKEGIQHYLRLLKRYAEVTLVEIKEEKVIVSRGAKVNSEKDTKKILGWLHESSLCIALDVTGVCDNSEVFANFLQSHLNQGYHKFTFVIGGPLGLSPRVLGACPFRLSLSPMTFTHEMSRVILLEQIYRAFSIIQGAKYHK